MTYNLSSLKPAKHFSRNTKKRIAYSAWAIASLSPLFIIGNHATLTIGGYALLSAFIGGAIGGAKSVVMTEVPSIKAAVNPTIIGSLATSSTLALML